MYIYMAFYVCKLLKYIKIKVHCTANLFPNTSCGLDSPHKCLWFGRGAHPAKKRPGGQWDQELSVVLHYQEDGYQHPMNGGPILYLELDPINPQPCNQIFFKCQVVVNIFTG